MLMNKHKDNDMEVYTLLTEHKVGNFENNNVMVFSAYERAEYIMLFDVDLTFEDIKERLSEEDWKKWVEDRRTENGFYAVVEEKNGFVTRVRHTICKQEID